MEAIILYETVIAFRKIFRCFFKIMKNINSILIIEMFYIFLKIPSLRMTCFLFTIYIYNYKLSDNFR